MKNERLGIVDLERSVDLFTEQYAFIKREGAEFTIL